MLRQHVFEVWLMSCRMKTELSDMHEPSLIKVGNILEDSMKGIEAQDVVELHLKQNDLFRLNLKKIKVHVISNI